MDKEPDTQGLVQIFIIVAGVLGMVVGAAAGYAFEGTNSRWLAILAGLVSVLVLTLVRLTFGPRFRRILLSPRQPSIRGRVVAYIGFASLLGALAAHDLVSMFEVRSDVLLGLTSGAFASLAMAVVMIIYLHDHPRMKLEF